MKNIFVVLLSLLLLLPSALAQDTGGSFGGGSFQKAPIDTGNSGSGVSGGGDFHNSNTSFSGNNFGGGFESNHSSSGEGSLAETPWWMFVIFFVFVYFFIIRKQGASKAMNSPVDESAGLYSLDIALSATAARDLQRRLEELGALTGTQDGLANALRETALAILRRKAEVEGAVLTSRERIPISQAEQLFTEAVTRARARYKIDVYLAQEGKIRKSAPPEGLGRDGVMEYLVISIIVGSYQPLGLPARLSDRKTIEEALSRLSSIQTSQLATLRVVWTPGDPNDSLTRDDLMLTFPDVVLL